MNNNYIKNKLLQNKNVACFAKAMKEEKYEVWIAGGAITATATNSLISDYDVYFSSKESCAEAIRYMKDEDAHCAFISDKSITYVLSNGSSFRNALGEYEAHTTIQFIFYAYYETAEDIFNHFDFSCNCGAYNILTGEFSFHKDFWLHNSQRFLSFNSKTKFPLISGLRVQKYIDKGYTTSRTEMMKIMFACASLKINSWVEFSNQVGNLYGFNFMDEKMWKDKDFSMELAMEILSGTDFSHTTYAPASNYKHPVDLIEHLVADKPILHIENEGAEYYPEVDSGETEVVLEAIEDGKLQVESITLREYLGDWVYCWMDEGSFTLTQATEKKNSWSNHIVYKDKEDVHTRNNNVLVKCSWTRFDIKECSQGDIRFSKLTPVEIIGRKQEVVKWKDGEKIPEYKPQISNMRSQSYNVNGFELGYHTPTPAYIKAKFREDHIRKHIKITGGGSKYARNTFEGVILEGGGDILAYELLLFADSYNLVFGGSIEINSSGKFSGSYNTD